jgi:hypothetical protein
MVPGDEFARLSISSLFNESFNLLKIFPSFIYDDTIDGVPVCNFLHD